MAFELDSVYHTETMVKILKEQGHLQLAMRVCGKVLEIHPERSHLRELYERLRNPFLRFGKSSSEPAETSEPFEVEEEITEPGVEAAALQAEESQVSSPPAVSVPPEEEVARKRKLETLQALLQKIQARS
ncbi:MAG: hypothetical protein U1F57_11465 [bacterium]